jgi:hypothetical protein
VVPKIGVQHGLKVDVSAFGGVPQPGSIRFRCSFYSLWSGPVLRFGLRFETAWRKKTQPFGHAHTLIVDPPATLGTATLGNSGAPSNGIASAVAVANDAGAAANSVVVPVSAEPSNNLSVGENFAFNFACGPHRVDGLPSTAFRLPAVQSPDTRELTAGLNVTHEDYGHTILMIMKAVPGAMFKRPCCMSATSTSSKRRREVGSIWCCAENGASHRSSR